MKNLINLFMPRMVALSCLFGLNYGDVVKEKSLKIKNLENSLHINNKDLNLNLEPLFVSLGSWCDVAINLRRLDLRKAAYPFDWIASVDCEKFLEIFYTDFKYFLDDNFLFILDSHVYNYYYNLDFPHENFLFIDSITKEIIYSVTKQKWTVFKEKYLKRINRFRSLKNYEGKVIFIRSSFGLSNHEERYFKDEKNVSISDEYASRLFCVLKDYFPKLDFSLIIIDISRSNAKLADRLYRLQKIANLDEIKQTTGFDLTSE